MRVVPPVVRNKLMWLLIIMMMTHVSFMVTVKGHTGTKTYGHNNFSAGTRIASVVVS